ncbi:MAG: hypothetical protein Q9160_008822 [Pyrenula sp. 1 TL-2023]
MALISDLSKELILEILSHSAWSLCAITRVSKYLCELGRLYLYRHVVLHLDLEEYGMFLRSIRTNETLRPLVRHLCLWFMSSEDDRSPIQSPQDILRLLPSLQSFKFLIDDNQIIDGSFDSIDDVPSLASRLQFRPTCHYTLVVMCQCTANDVLDFIFQKRVHHLEVDYLSIKSMSDNPDNDITRPLPLHTAALESLALGFSICMPCALLKHILRFLSALQSLECAIPTTHPAESELISSFPRRTGPVEPSSVTSAISPTAHSLETLELIGYKEFDQIDEEEEEWIGHDGTRLDLNSFIKLKRLTCPSYLLFDAFEAGPGRHATYILLPPALEELTIHFDFDHYIYTKPDQDTQALQSAVNNPDHYAWLTEIATNKPQRFPRLRRLSLIERYKTSRCMEWDMPEDLKQAFDDAGIELWTRKRF